MSFRRNRRSTARSALVLAGALAVSACGSRGSTPVATHQPDGGFVIHERVKASSRVRADFEQAIRLLEQGRYDAGIALLASVSEAEPRMTSAHLDLGIAYAATGDLARARASLERARELSPRHPVVHNELGIVYRRLGLFQEARATYEKALELHPDFHFARLNLAILCDLYLADPGCALEHYERYAQAVPGDASAADWLAELRSRSGR
jgi:tetratricopeptide (TPR) repeat protein